VTPLALPVGLLVEILVSDPFEIGVRPLEATVVTSGVAADAPGVLSVLLRLRDPIQFRGVHWEYVVARPTRASKDLSEVATNSTVDSAMTGVPQAKATSSDPLDLSWWRGGLAMLGSISKR
jgi:hypothetical protein